MCIWSKPYIVSKACGCGSRRYVYEQATRRVGGKTQTRNRYLGILGQVRLRPSPVSFDAIVTTTMVEAVRRIKGQTTVSMTRRPEDIAGMAEQATGNGEPKYLADVPSGLQDLWRVNKELFSKAWMLGSLAEFLKKMGVPSEHVDEEALAVFYGKVKGANERADDAVDTRLEEPDPFERAMSERAVRAIEEFGQQHPDYNSPWAKYWRAHWHNSESIAAHPDEPRYRIFDIDEGGHFGEGKPSPPMKRSTR